MHPDCRSPQSIDMTPLTPIPPFDAARPARRPRIGLSFALAMTAALALIAGDATAASVAHARAYVLRRGDARILVVAESHYGTRLEGDGYTERVIAPAYRAAQVALIENGAPWHPTAADAMYLAADCASPPGGKPALPIDKRATSYTDATKATVRDLTLQFQAFEPAWNSNGDVLLRHGELELDYVVLPQLSSVAWQRLAAAQDAPARQGVEGLFRGLAQRLIRLDASGRALPEIRPIETIGDRWAALCAAAPDIRDAYLREQLQGAQRLLQWLNRAGTSWQAASADLETSFVSTLACIDRRPACEFTTSQSSQAAVLSGTSPARTPAVHEIAVRNRNLLWLNRLLDVSARNARVVAVVGAMHLPDLIVQGKTQPGLLSLLRERSFSVTAVESEKDLKQGYLP